MTSYFDYTNNAHLALLPNEFRSATDLADVAALAEVDVIAQYSEDAPDRRYTVLDPTVSPSAHSPMSPSSYDTGISVATQVGTSNVYVYLRGYKTDAADAAVDPSLVLALRREIAGVISWRLRQWDKNTLVRAESAGGGSNASKTYRNDADDPFPPGFGRWLRPFDARRPVVGL